MLDEGFNVGVVGATGAVGQVLLRVLDERKFPVKKLAPFASSRSVGRKIPWRGTSFPCRELSPGCFAGLDFVFFDASDAVSQRWAPQAVQEGAWVIDNSGYFRMSQEVPLIVPEVNGHLLKTELFSKKKFVAGPNCSAAQLVVALSPIQKKWGLNRVIVSTYQSVSGAGAEAMKELAELTGKMLEGDPSRSSHTFPPRVFPHSIAFSCIPQIGSFKEDGYTSEELKIMEECRKILDLPNLKITATAIRVPTFSCHCESVYIETKEPFQIDQVRQALQDQEGIVVMDDPAKQKYPLGVTHLEDLVESASGKDDVYVGRIRRDLSVETGLNLWVVSDNLRKGAASNAVQIGEFILRNQRG